MDDKWLIIFVQIFVVFMLIFLITFFIKLNNAIKMEKRISRYAVKGNKRKELSYYDKVINAYIGFVKKQRKKVTKLFPSLVRRYDKYVTDGTVRASDYVTHKFVISILFVIFTIITMSIQDEFVSVFQILFSLVLGFYFLDIFLLISTKYKKRKIENDMLRAIIIMNSAFKSGKSTIQAVEIASNKLSKPINLEFKKMHKEMKYGLSVDEVFSRFAKRINIEEAEYLSSSLTILNKTGGNIVAVFNSIEKTLFDKMKLKEELKNLTAVSKLLVKILMFIPIVFVLAIYILNPTYFDPFFASLEGYILLSVVFILFIVYVIILNKIIKVEY